MSSYVEISLAEMEGLLAPMGFRRISLDGVQEVVLARRCDQEGRALSLRVFTSITHGVSRGVGQDAIRVQLVWRDPDGEIRKVGTSKRVNRVPGWSKRLLARIEAWGEMVGPWCPGCGAPMVQRKSGKKGVSQLFWGCSTFPKCRRTM